MSKKLALLLQDKQMCEPVDFDIPEIFTTWRSHMAHAHILMKSTEWGVGLCGDNEDCIEDADGFLVEYRRSLPRADVGSVYISSDNYCGNYIVGTLLHKVYPACQTIILDRYRGFPSNVVACETLSIRNFIAISTQGWDNPFEYLRRIPSIENALFESEDCYMKSYSNENDASIKRPFTEVFAECVERYAKNLKQIMFFTCSSEIFAAPDGWGYRLLKFDGSQTWYWVLYFENEYEEARLSARRCKQRVNIIGQELAMCASD